MNYTDIKSAARTVLPFSVFLSVIALVLAYFEVQIEGANGWAAALPTWRTTDPNITWIFGGRPMTGYHLSLTLLLLLFFHWPVLFTRWNLTMEARTVSAFALLAVVWDFLWFVINPHFGLERYNSANVWWFTRWALGVPVDYFVGISAALFIRCIPSFVRRERFLNSFLEGILFIGLTISIIFIITIIAHTIL